MKRIFCLVLIFIIVVGSSLSANALTVKQSTVYGKLEDTLHDEILERAMSLLNAVQESRDFPEVLRVNQVNIGEEIPLYEVCEDSINQIGLKYFPVFSDEEIVGIIIARIRSDGQFVLEYVNGFAKDFNEYYNKKSEICIFVDATSVWISDGVKLEKIYENSDFIDGRADLNSTKYKNGNLYIEDVYKEKLAKNKNVSLSAENGDNFTRSVITGAEILTVPIKTQPKGSLYCWACTATSIGQYKVPSVILDAADIARAYTGSTTTPMPIDTIRTILDAQYGLDTDPAHSTYLRMSNVQDNIDYDNPIAAFVDWSAFGGHFVVVRGYSVLGLTTDSLQYVYIMDPDVGYRVMEVEGTAVDREIKYYKENDEDTVYRMPSYLELS